MPLLVSERSRAAVVVLCLGLIGGTGCITAEIISNEKQKAARQAAEEKRAVAIKAYKDLAAQGDLDASVKLAQEYLRQQPDKYRNVPAALELLQRAADRDYGPAQYAYGWLLVTGASDANVGERQVVPEPARGMELLKRAASRHCAYERQPGWFDKRNVAYAINEFLRQGLYVSRDQDAADTWLARSVVHCRYPDGVRLEQIFSVPKNTSMPLQTEALAWLMLAGDDARTAKRRASMSPQELDAATQRASVLRAKVRASEQQYPAPIDAKRP